MIRIVKMHFKKEHIENFKILFDERKTKIKNFEGCNYLALWQDENNEAIFYTYSIWDNNKHLDNYRFSELFKDTWSTVKMWFEEKAMAFSANQLMEIK